MGRWAHLLVERGGYWWHSYTRIVLQGGSLLMVITPNMGLVRWDLNTDPYDHSQLSANFEQIDEHDHTPGHGVRLGTDSLLDGAITTEKLADHAVTTIKIADGAVGEQQL